MNEKMQKRRNPPEQHLGAKRLRQQRFWPCPICNRSFALFRLEEHVNQCLDTSPCPSTSLSPPTTKGRVSCELPAVELNPRSLGGSVDGRGESRAVQTSTSPSGSVSSGKTSSSPTERALSLEGNLVQQPPNENVKDGGRGWAFPVEVEDRMKAQRCKLEYSGSNVHRDCEITDLSAENPGTGLDGGGLDENGMSQDRSDGNDLAMDIFYHKEKPACHDSCIRWLQVSVSIGDSMTFFYRRFPPSSRRKSGVSISVDEEAVRSCQDGDAAHNREHQILLESGDVLVFGGKSRLVYHGTRHVQPGTRPPGLHMVPGRLNFTFRQTIAKAI